MAENPRHVVRELRDVLQRLESELAAATPASTAGLDRSIDAASEIVRKLQVLREAHTGSADPAENFSSGEAQSEGRTRESAPALQKREFVLLALQELDWPASPTTISSFIKHRWGGHVQATQFASIRKGDERAWERGRRARPFIVPALNASDLSPRPRTYAVSTWPAEKRVMGSLSERADAFRVLLAACENTEHDEGGAWRSLITMIASDFRFGGKNEKNETIAKAARAALGLIANDDEKSRNVGAMWLMRLPERYQLFGRPLGFDVVKGGKHA